MYIHLRQSPYKRPHPTTWVNVLSNPLPLITFQSQTILLQSQTSVLNIGYSLSSLSYKALSQLSQYNLFYSTCFDCGVLLYIYCHRIVTMMIQSTFNLVKLLTL